MLNTNIRMGNTTQNVVFNTPSHGMIQRSNPKSFFIRFDATSKIEERVFPGNGNQAYLQNKEYPYNPFDITVLQVMVFGDDRYLCEVIRNTDLIEEIINP